MNPRLLATILVSLFLAAAAAGIGVFFLWERSSTWRGTYEVEQIDYQPPPPAGEEVLVDDQLEEKTPLVFDPTQVDRRPLGAKGEWLVNASAAVLRLDAPLLKPDQEPHLLTIHPSYAAAFAANHGATVLPSVNLLDGKAKQFDDGLYAALDLAYYQGLKDSFISHVQLVRRLYDRAGKDSVAAPYLAAGLELAGVAVETTDRAEKDRLLREFQSNEVASKPIGFYTWNDSLGTCFRFLRFFQREFDPEHLAVPLSITRLLAQDKTILADYQKTLGFYARLTNPYICLSTADLIGMPAPDADRFSKLCKQKKVSHATVALFPPSTSKEVVLFERLFPLGIPENVDLMRELVRRIRSGQVNLQPGPDSGWYDHQVYALETLLLPEKGEERDKLVLTKAYKKRMLEAFQAMITKRRETHARGGAMSASAPMAMERPDKIRPRLRIEPCPSYYLRTARAYAFLATFLEAAVGKDALHALHGLKKEGPRALDLHTELLAMRDLFYGLYLISAEDIGLKAAFAKGEPVDAARCYQQAGDWVAKAFGDEDLAADTRVAVPIFIDTPRQMTRLWTTLGVRLAKLDARYLRPPQLKPAQGPGDWQVVEDWRLDKSDYLIPVDEYAEVELRGLKVLTREELRAVCDREKTKEAILEALRR